MNEHYESEQEAASYVASSRLSRRGLLAAGTALGATAALGATVPAIAATTTVDTNYTDDTDVLLKNPERGMYLNWVPKKERPGYHTLVEGWLPLHTVCNQELVWNGLGIAGTTPALNTFASRLEECRSNGVKVIFRPRYDTADSDGNKPSSCGLFHADRLDRQLRHIDVIATMLSKYRDVVAFIQAGYIGRWGEWNNEGYPDSTAPFLYNYDSRNAIIDRALSAYAAAGLRQHVELRRPVFAKEVEDRYRKRVPYTKPNVGLHNDCFMSSNSDRGTYSDFLGSTSLKLPPSPANFGSTTAAKDWAKAWTANRSFGGETCYITRATTNPSYGTERWRSCPNMKTEPASLHMNYLNALHADTAVKTWGDGGCLDDIQSKLGYRFQVKRVEYLPTIPAGQSFSITVDIKNDGWARLHKPRRAQLFLRTVSSTWTTPSPFGVQNGKGNTAEWAPGTTTRVQFGGTAPTAGKYTLHIAIFDPDAEVKWNKSAKSPNHTYAYAVRMATKRGGKNIFNAGTDADYTGATGMNDLGITITVQ